jgi:DNA-directed RNA polymerase subunit N (RpoN/RPB10)
MMPMVCTCGSLLGHIEIEYEKQIKKLLDKNNQEDYAEDQKKLVNSLIPSHKWCCRSNLLTYIDIVKEIKG